MPAIAEDVLEAIGRAEIVSGMLILPAVEPKLYAKIKPILAALGAQWDRKSAAHILSEGADEAIRQLCITRQFTDTKAELGQFDTPAELAIRVVDIADIKLGMSVLEPSAGVGNLVAAILDVVTCGVVAAVEIDPKRHAILCKRFPLVAAAPPSLTDFLTIEPRAVFDRVVMNPPFAKHADVDHVSHALKFLKPGGKLTAIVGAGAEFRDTTKYRKFRDSVSRITKLPPDSFKESGTRVNTLLVEILT